MPTTPRKNDETAGSLGRLTRGCPTGESPGANGFATGWFGPVRPRTLFRMKPVSTFLQFALLGCAAVSLSANPAEPAAPSNADAPTGKSVNVGGTEARDRYDTIHSDKTRINTTGGDSTDAAHDIQLSRRDRRFLERASRSMEGQMRVAKLAAQRSGDPRVRSYAQQVANAHQEAHSALLALAAKKGLNLMPEAEAGDKSFNSLSEFTDAEFDQRFVEHMSDAHEDDISLFERTSRKAEDAEVAGLASKLLTALQQHRDTALEIERTQTR